LGLAQALNVPEDLVGSNAAKKRGTGPIGKKKQLFEAASQLPRSQQQSFAAVLDLSSINTVCGDGLTLLARPSDYDFL